MMKTLISLVLCLSLCACGAMAAEAPSIVCTNFPCYDFARAVTGAAADIRLLIRPGAEVHSYEPTPADVMEIAGCDLFVYIGGESDAWVEDILDSFGDDAPATLRMFDCVEARAADGHAIEAGHDHNHDHDHGHTVEEYDEHIWTSPKNAVLMLNALVEKLGSISVENAQAYAENAQAYIAQIEALDASFEDVIANSQRREMIFADRFPFLYFAKEYDIDYVSAFPSCSSESEPSAKTMMELIDRVISDAVPAIYTIELSNQKTAQTISSETGAKVLTFHSVQNLTEADFSAGETYVSLMQRNLEALREGLN